MMSPEGGPRIERRGEFTGGRFQSIERSLFFPEMRPNHTNRHQAAVRDRLLGEFEWLAADLQSSAGSEMDAKLKTTALAGSKLETSTRGRRSSLTKPVSVAAQVPEQRQVRTSHFDEADLRSSPTRLRSPSCVAPPRPVRPRSPRAWTLPLCCQEPAAPRLSPGPVFLARRRPTLA